MYLWKCHMGRFIITELQQNERYRFTAWLICIIGALFYCYEYFIRIAPSVMSADIMRTFHLNATGFGDLVAFFYYIYTPMQLVVGIFMDRYGPRRLLVLACLACVIGVLLFASTNLFVVAAIGRLLIGFGAAFAFVGALKLASIWLPPERFATISGLVTTLGMIGAMTSDIAMAHLVDKYGWRFTLFILAILGIVLIVFMFFIVQDRLKTTQKKPVFIPELSFRDVFIGLFQALKSGQIWINGMIGCFMYLPVTVFAELWGIPYLIQTHHLSNMKATEVVSFLFLGWAVGATFSGWLSDIIGLRRLPLIIGSIGALILVCIILYVPGLPESMLFPLFFFFGFMTSIQVIVFAIGREVSPKHIAATAVSVTNMFTMIGGAIFQPVIGVILDMNWAGKLSHGIPIYSTESYTLALSVLPMALLITIFLSFMLKETYCQLISS